MITLNDLNNLLLNLSNSEIDNNRVLDLVSSIPNINIEAIKDVVSVTILHLNSSTEQSYKGIVRVGDISSTIDLYHQNGSYIVG